MHSLDTLGPDRFDPDAQPVLALAHNEANLVGAFLDHYRAICRPSFLIVDDRSTDRTRALLADQPDVTLFAPAAGTRYDSHKVAWRSEILDHYADGRWVLVPDLDEHFVFAGLERRNLSDYVAALEREGAEAVATLMVDMYADRPLNDHCYDPADGVPLAEAFPYFDGPGPAPLGYFLARKSRRNGSSPPVKFHGGMRQRLFDGMGLAGIGQGKLDRLDRFCRLDQAITPGWWERYAQLRAGRVIRGGINMTKLALIKWHRGMAFSGGPHAVDRRLRMSESIAVLRHYVFTRGAAGIDYYVDRGQHAEGARYYREMRNRADVLARSPVFEGSRRYAGSGSLSGLLRDVPGDGP